MSTGEIHALGTIRMLGEVLNGVLNPPLAPGHLSCSSLECALGRERGCCSAALTGASQALVGARRRRQARPQKDDSAAKAMDTPRKIATATTRNHPLRSTETEHGAPDNDAHRGAESEAPMLSTPPMGFEASPLARVVVLLFVLVAGHPPPRPASSSVVRRRRGGAGRPNVCSIDKWAKQ